jgi:trimeric autotransporter adhesin
MQHRYVCLRFFASFFLATILVVSAFGQQSFEPPQLIEQPQLTPPSPPQPPKLSAFDSLNRAHPGRLDSLLRTIREQEEARTKDPALNRVPTERLDVALAQLAKTRPGSTNVGIPGITWAERGPAGVAAKVRVHLVDPNDPTGKKVWAGSEAGGLWYTPDITDVNASWTVVSDGWENRNVAALAADPANPQTMYAGTGEMVVDYFGQKGGGIWKTTDGGTTWSRLGSTIPAGSTTLQSAFYGISKLIVSSGGVFAATRRGIVRSTDGGNSWAFVLAPQQGIGGTAVSGGDDGMSDLEMGSDGILYAATRTGRLFRATNTAGTAWTEITPPGSTTPYNGTRTELALAPSTSGSGQVVYALGVFYNSSVYNKDIKWFVKSTDGGATWANVPRPVHPWYINNPTNADFTVGSGVSTLVMTVLPTDAANVYVGGNYYVFNSADGGQTWDYGAYINRMMTFSVQSGRAIWSSNGYGVGYKQLPLDQYNYLYQRNKGFRVTETAGAAMRNVPGSPYILSVTPDGPGFYEQREASINGSSQLSSNGGNHTYIDQDQPGIHLVTDFGGNTFIRNTINSTTFTFYYSSGSSYYCTASEYDSRINTRYVWNNGYYKITDVGGSNVTSAWTGFSLGRPTAFRAGAESNSLYVAIQSYDGGDNNPKLYRILNAHTNSPSVTRIDAGAFPAGATINHIAVGATDNQLLVTLSNYGVKSVWFSSNVGASWVSKDETSHGLPDVPVYGALFNPNNGQQVMLATEAGVWTTTNIEDANPGWESGNAGMPIIRVNQLQVRRSDGRVIAATNGRGVWETNVWNVPNTPPTLTVTSISATSVCAGSSQVQVSFNLTNGSSARYAVRLSDANGNFGSNTYDNTTGTGSPLTLYVPYSTTYGTGYRVRVEALDLGVTGVSSQSLAISDLLSNNYVRVKDRRNYYDPILQGYSFTGYLCSGSTAILRAAYGNTGEVFRPSVSVRWALNGTEISGQQSSTLPATAAGNYSFTATEHGCIVTSNGSYNLYQSSSLNNSPAYDYRDDPRCTGTAVVIGVGTIGEVGTYQWYKDSVAIAGATSITYAATTSGLYSYSASEGTCISPPSFGNKIPLTFGGAIYSSPIYYSSSSLTLCGGSSVYFSTNRSATNTTFQWMKDGVPLVGFTGPYYYAYSPGTYTLQYKSGNCTAISEAAVVVTGSLGPNEVRFDGSKTVCTGSQKYLYSRLVNGSFQWTKDGVDIPGATNSYYYATSSGAYSVRVTNYGCVATAPPVALVFSSQIRQQIGADEYCTYGYVYGRDYVDVPGTRLYTWFRNGAVISSNTNNSYYYVNQTGTYSFSVSYGTSGCTGVSGNYRFTVGSVSKPVIAARSPAERCGGTAPYLFRTQGAGTYWKRNGTRILLATNTYNYYPAESGRYTLVYEQGGCYAESDPIDVVIGVPTAGTLTGSAVVQAGQSATLAVGLSGVGPWAFTLTNGQTVQGITQNPYSFVVSPSATTSYSLAAVRSTCEAGAATGSARVSIGSGLADVSISSFVSTRTPRVGEPVSYFITLRNEGPQAAQGVQLTDRLPTGMSYVDGDPGWQIGPNNLLTLNVGTLQNGEIRTVSFRARADVGGVFFNATEVSDNQTPDPDSQPGSGTGDGQDDVAVTDFRTSDQNGPLVVSANPNQQLLPTVSSNQPTPPTDMADLSLHMVANAALISPKGEVMLTTRVANRGARATSGVRVDVRIPNGTYLSADNLWVTVSAPATASYYISDIAANGSATLLIRWRPQASGDITAEIADSALPDPDSTPNNRNTRPGEDDEAAVSVRVR